MKSKENILKDNQEICIFLLPLVISVAGHLGLFSFFINLEVENSSRAGLSQNINNFYKANLWRFLDFDISVLGGMAAIVTSLIIANAVSPNSYRSESEYKYSRQLTILTRSVSIIGYLCSLLHLNSVIVNFLVGYENGDKALSGLMVGIVGLLLFHHGFFNAIPDSRIASVRVRELRVQIREKKEDLLSEREDFLPLLLAGSNNYENINLNFSRKSKKIFRTRFLVRKSWISLVFHLVSILMLFATIREINQVFALGYFFMILLLAGYLFGLAEILIRERATRKAGIGNKFIDITMAYFMTILFAIISVFLFLMPIFFIGGGFLKTSIIIAFVIYLISGYFIFKNLSDVHMKGSEGKTVRWVLLNREIVSLRRRLRANNRIIENNRNILIDKFI